MHPHTCPTDIHTPPKVKYVQNIKHACNNKPTLYCSNNFFSLQSGFHVNLLFHNMMCVPANKQHAKIHGAYSEHKMEKPVTIWYIVFQSFYVPELQIFEKFFYIFNCFNSFLTFIDLTIGWIRLNNIQPITCIHL